MAHSGSSCSILGSNANLPVTLRLLAKSIIKHHGNLKRDLSRVPNLWPVFSVSLVIRKSNGNPFTTIC